MKRTEMEARTVWVLFLQTILLSPTLSLQIETDRLSLIAFKAQITHDPLGRLSSWNDSLYFCQWSGVTCGRRHQRVIKLELNSSRLMGSLTPHIGNLTFLRIIYLQNNSLSQNIPQELGRLFRLQVLGLSSNMFTGEIPVNISRCSNLLRLVISYNNLTGKLPPELGSLRKLQVLIFEMNSLVGEIPPAFGNLSSLERIYGPRNSLSGGIPDSIGQLTSLKQLSFGANNLSGTIPPSIYNLSALTLFSVPVNQIHGSLPPDLGQTLPNLETFNIYTNELSGLIPTTISNASNLSSFSIAGNKFTGKVPTMASLHKLQGVRLSDNNLGYGRDDDLSFLYSLANNTNLEYLGISQNNFGGVLPEIISNFSTKLVKLIFGENQIRGSIPTDIGNLISLTALGLEKNQLTGIIPNSMGKLQNLNALFLNGNKISGRIPSSLGNLTSLSQFHLAQNNLQGSLPSSLGNCQRLLFMVLYQNNLSGPIPKEVVSISSLALNLDLHGNQLTGSLPLEVGKLVNLVYLDVSNNKLSGEIPGSLAGCETLQALYLDGNFLQGAIPQSLSSLRAMQDLNLSHNNLTGPIPMYLADFKLLENLDLSYNDFEDEVPMKGVFQNASAISVLGNEKLCGGIPQLNLPRCNSDSNGSTSSTLKLIFAIACGILGLILLTSFLLFYGLRKTKNNSASESSLGTFFCRVAYEDLLKATDGFSSANLVGVGSFGSVYRGILRQDDTVVAVKVLNLRHKGASKSFTVECEALKNIRHRNLVQVLTACSSVDSQGNDFKALVYKFMENGSLERWLHPAQESDQANESRNLNLIQRLNIAIDLASALDYLHHSCQPPIVHCDLKPSNVLLDSDMTAHVGDFGLARFLSEASHQLSSTQSSSLGIKGTIGYAAPEYGMGSEVTTYGDVYSYGILLLEMFTGRRPTDGMFNDGLNLHNFAKMALPNQVVEVVDPMLLKENEETDTLHGMNNIGNHKILECLIPIVKVGIACSTELPQDRMNIGSVAVELHHIRERLLRNGTRGQHQVIVLSPNRN